MIIKKNQIRIYHTIDGCTHYKVNDTYHREDGPALIWNNGDNHWIYNGKYHRIGGPAIDNVDGLKMWFKHGLLHRLDGPAKQTVASWEREWWIEGKMICRGSCSPEFERLVKLYSFI